MYLKDEIPARYHYADSLRVAPILVLAHLGYGVVPDKVRFHVLYVGLSLVSVSLRPIIANS